MRSQVSAELLIVIAVLAALAVYVFTQMQSSAEAMGAKYEEATGELNDIIDQMLSG
ncbi:MAG: hypothetical protein GXO00_03225 [Candidatus Diapherotrites archaeon]|nr:hypothetical protein [Candidatus Diapherotrites archaeon]